MANRIGAPLPRNVGKQPERLLDRGDPHAVPVKDRGAQDQDRGVDEKRQR